MALMYTMSVFMILTPLLGMWVLTSRISRRSKTTILVSVAVAMVIIPIAAIWIFNGKSDVSIPLDLLRMAPPSHP
jgi:hypothetical protein